jgi:starch synthase
VPQALMQAMACGLAVVTTPVGSIEELVHDGRTGLIVPPSDPPALARAIASLLDEPARREALGKAAAAEAVARLGEDAMVDAMIGVFSQAAACAAPPTASGRSG